MKTIHRIAAFGAAAAAATALAVGAAGVATAATQPAAPAASFTVQNHDSNGYELRLDNITSFNTAWLPGLEGQIIRPGETSSPIPVSPLGNQSLATGVVIGYSVLDSGGNVVDHSLLSGFRLNNDGSTVIQSSENWTSCDSGEVSLTEDLPGQCSFSPGTSPVLTFDATPSN